ncbi:DNA polymerase II large subunit [Candidatus Woesearchaeota archaeon]|nr:DNA polymerase II large subunit [Candidatus Woesearchaeota archaeon]
MFSDTIQSYFNSIEAQVKEIYEIAGKARSLGFDPEETVPVPLAKDMAERVEGIIGTVCPALFRSGLSQRIKELEKTYGDLDWRVALEISLEVAQEKFCKFESKVKAMETGIRVGIAYLTLGIVASPIEGFVELKLKKTHDGKDFFSLMYSGPIRSAGGTAAAVSVIVADYVRVKMGYAPYDPTEDEVQRLVIELYDYHDYINNLQYLPSADEITFLGRHLPVQVNGDPSEEREVSNFKDLPRVETNRIRSGVCLVLGEGVAQKAKKVYKQLSKWGSSYGLGHWQFLEAFLELQKSVKAKGEQKKEAKVSPVYTYIEDLVAGRPVLTHPLRAGGFRLRYGRSRTSGYSAAAIHPATMAVLHDYLAIGTQLKVERPGKACSLGSCDTIEGPIVKLANGTVIKLGNLAQSGSFKGDVVEILFLGDILFSYGDFFNRAHVLVPPGYCPEWWVQQLEKQIVTLFGSFDISKAASLSGVGQELVEKLLRDPLREIPPAEDAIRLSLGLKVPLHPAHTFYFSLIKPPEFIELLQWMSEGKPFFEGESITKVVLPHRETPKRYLELIGVPHQCASSEFVVLEKEESAIFEKLFGLGRLIDIEKWKACLKEHSLNGTLELINACSPIPLKDKSGIFIGARMGRPEKAKMRKMTGSPHALFPVGDEGGKMRSFQSALEEGKVTAESRIFRCNSCKTETFFGVCERCGQKTAKVFYCNRCGIIESKECPHGKALPFQKREIDIISLFKALQARLGEKNLPDMIKGVRGTSNKEHLPEHLAKGILRAKHDIYVNKDGTTRYDMTQLPITHFKPKEIGTSVGKLLSLGYSLDIHGAPLSDEEQILELKPQDVILPACPDSPEEGADVVFLRMAQFIDDLLAGLYKLPPYFKVKKREDLIGHLINGLAPHISSSIVGRIIGFSKTQGFFAHPFFHAAMRRDCDGDEASATLLLDTLLNFSKEFLPDNRGATQDAPLVLTLRIIPTEVDDMIFDIDIAQKYPLAFYEAAEQFLEPGTVPVERVHSRLHTLNAYEHFGFTHDTSDLNRGVLCSAYKTLPSMEEKLKGQMILAEKIRAVDQADVARLVIDKHFIRDIKGNLRKFSQQEFRCVQCNAKYRRPPLAGKCAKCSGKLLFTVPEGAIVKYLEPAISLATKYDLPAYVKQSLELVKRRVEGIFGKETEKQIGLGKWF